ncbi:hypothetical protein, conserved [Eimeria necatrix]|uniref:Uncharacterized protein n=1 Tax=Eimeria necatrix TaxID=51315 RepID=U6MUW3_9EIME|nr:hypothetical protein, conserved [Eimeria necatrix]CDJ66239.1 hypothetical protein, conserved [Eimeria necatrix]
MQSAGEPPGSECTYTSDAAAASGSACLVLANLLQTGSQEQLLQFPLLQQPQQLQQLLQQLLEDRAPPVQAAALQVYRHLVRHSKGQQQLVTVCWELLPAVHAAAAAAAAAASHGAGEWVPASDALAAAKRLCRASAPLLLSPPAAAAAAAAKAAQITDLAFGHLYSANPAAEQLLLQLLRIRAGSSGVTEEAANTLLSELESSSSSMTGRRLQQLGDYLFRVLLRVHADAAAAAAAEAAESDAEDAAPAAAELEPDLVEDNWEAVL